MRNIYFFIILFEFISFKLRAAPNDVIAVVPFDVVGDVDNPEIFSHGLPSAISNALARHHEFYIVERLKISALLNELHLGQAGLVSERNVSHIGQMLGAKYIIMGVVQKIGCDVRVQTRIVEVSTSRIIHSFKNDMIIIKNTDVFKLQDMISNKIWMLFSFRSLPNAVDSTGLKPTLSDKAFLQYSMGLKYFDNGDIRMGEESLKKSLVEDPHFEWADSVRKRAEKAFRDFEQEIQKRENQ
jgi:TolB-like protein